MSAIADPRPVLAESYLEAVADAAAADAGGLDPALLGDFLTTTLAAAASGRRLRKAELDRYSERGAAAALDGVALRALVDLYLSSAWRLWRDKPTEQGETVDSVRAAALAVLRAADDGVAALVAGFQLARGDLSRRQESGRREVFDALLAGGAESARFLDRAADLGLDLSAPHAVLVVRAADSAFDDPASAALLGRLERDLVGRSGDAGVLLAVKASLLVCIFAAPDRAAVQLVSEALAAALDSGGKRGWRGAVGRAAAGPDGVRASYEQARDGLDLADRLGLTTPMVDAGELAVHRLLMRDRTALTDLITTVLHPLQAARGGALPLLETLEAFYSCGESPTRTARRLHLSVRAVTYRLTRIEQLLGVSPTDAEVRFSLQTAVLGARLTGWPA